MKDLIIIGGGPAGTSAALYALRAGLSVSLFRKDTGSLAKAERIENFFGFSGSGAELAERGVVQARELGAEIIGDEVIELALEEIFTVNELEARTVVLATGATRVAPAVPGLADFEGRGVSYCAVCDGFFHRGKNVAVLGNGAYALHEAQALLPLAATVTLLTDGKPLTADMPESIKVIEEPLAAITGEKKLEAVAFKNKDNLPLSGLFVAVGSAGGTDLARKIGATVKDNSVVTDGFMRTSVAGLWAAGDCTAGVKQVAKAVHEGMIAGMDVIKYIRANH
jgi:thioredoxin reductase (NADPH)